MSAKHKRSLSAGNLKTEEESSFNDTVSDIEPAPKPARFKSSEGSNKKPRPAPIPKKKKDLPVLASPDEMRTQVRATIQKSIPVRLSKGWIPAKALRIGYPCMNRSIGASGGHVFRKANHSVERVIQSVQMNLDEIERMLKWNAEKGLGFFRIGSEVVPFASHEDYRDVFDWRKHFATQLTRIGMRISMHPDQFVLLNTPKLDVLRRSIAELEYQGSLLDAMGLDTTAKMQIHVGGVYGNKPEAMERFVTEYKKLPPVISRRLVIENDDRLYSLQDCLALHKQTGVPILFDNLHHECLHNGEPMAQAAIDAAKTWVRERDGIPLFDYSSQEPDARKGNHAQTINIAHWHKYISELAGIAMEADIMLEIKDKENSALRALMHLELLSETK